MEAVEFIKTLQKLCEGKGCDDCPLHDIDRCDVRYVEDPEETVRIIEEWGKEQESEKPEHEQSGEELLSKYIDLSKMPQLETWESFREGEGCSFVAVSDLIQALRQAEAHTGEVAPVVHGHWMSWEEMFPEQTPRKKNNLGVFCSECNSHNDTRRNYCPECGADMRGGNEYGDES